MGRKPACRGVPAVYPYVGQFVHLAQLQYQSELAAHQGCREIEVHPVAGNAGESPQFRDRVPGIKAIPFDVYRRRDPDPLAGPP